MTDQIDNDEKELIEYEKELREIFERDIEAFGIEVYTQIQENKERDIQALRDEAIILAETVQLKEYSDALDAHNAKLNQLSHSVKEYYTQKFAEARLLSYCSANGCKKERKVRCCFFAFYCSESCQIKHWRDHIKVCNRKEFFQGCGSNI